MSLSMTGFHIYIFNLFPHNQTEPLAEHGHEEHHLLVFIHAVASSWRTFLFLQLAALHSLSFRHRYNHLQETFPLPSTVGQESPNIPHFPLDECVSHYDSITCILVCYHYYPMGFMEIRTVWFILYLRHPNRIWHTVWAQEVFPEVINVIRYSINLPAHKL